MTAAVMVKLDLGSVVLRRMRLDDIEAVKALIKVVMLYKPYSYTLELPFFGVLQNCIIQ